MAAATKQLLGNDRSSTAANTALGFVRRLFATPRSPGIDLATRALAGIIDDATVAAVMTGYTQELIESLSE